jgi:hypothetical protein
MKKGWIILIIFASGLIYYLNSRRIKVRSNFEELNSLVKLEIKSRKCLWTIEKMGNNNFDFFNIGPTDYVIHAIIFLDKKDSIETKAFLVKNEFKPIDKKSQVKNKIRNISWLPKNIDFENLYNKYFTSSKSSGYYFFDQIVLIKNEYMIIRFVTH